MKTKINYRKISAFLPKGYRKKYKNLINKKVMHQLARFFFLVFLGCVVFLLGLVFVLRQELSKRNEIYTSLLNKKAYWVALVKQYPNAPDVLYNAALSAKNIGSEKEALEYLNKALILDPLFMEARLLKKSIEE